MRLVEQQWFAISPFTLQEMNQFKKTNSVLLLLRRSWGVRGRCRRWRERSAHGRRRRGRRRGEGSEKRTTSLFQSTHCKQIRRDNPAGMPRREENVQSNSRRWRKAKDKHRHKWEWAIGKTKRTTSISRLERSLAGKTTKEENKGKEKNSKRQGLVRNTRERSMRCELTAGCLLEWWCQTNSENTRRRSGG